MNETTKTEQERDPLANIEADVDPLPFDTAPPSARQIKLAEKRGEIEKPERGISLMGGLTAADLATLDVEKVEALLGMQERIDARNAERSMSDALARFQSACPRVHKGKKGGHGNYAGFDDVMSAVQRHLAENGISVSFDTEAVEGALCATCHVMHRDGARFSRKATVPVDSSGRMNSAQQMGSAISYAKRYALTAALNIVTTDEDDDGQSAGTQTITTVQGDRLRDLIAAIEDEHEVERWFKWLNVKDLEEIPENKFAKAETALGRIIKKQEGVQ